MTTAAALLGACFACFAAGVGWGYLIGSARMARTASSRVMRILEIPVDDDEDFNLEQYIKQRRADARKESGEWNQI